MSTVHQYHCAVCDTIATDCTAIEHHMFIYSLNSMRTVSDIVYLHYRVTSDHQKLPATHCVVIVVLQRVSV